ncbi:LrgB family protein [Gorillibacterium sp. sgz500922]|uniref:LrgB family protein n=1 Tax=Gorillibacterium sp. sgz500922 TaxID=3446694 RepID=UPI003F67EA41
MASLIAIAGLLSTVAVYAAVRRLYGRKPSVLFTPILLVPIVLLLLLAVTGISYTAYNKGANILTFLLKPATVAFAIPIYKHFDLLKKHAWEILGSVLIGSFAGISTSMLVGELFRLSPQVVGSLAPRSVTTPIAMEISTMIGANATLTAVFVIITGLLGFIVGPSVIRMLSIESRVSKGILMGMSSHGVGTSKAFELGDVEGTVSSLTMVLAAIATFMLAPWIVPLLG